MSEMTKTSPSQVSLSYILQSFQDVKYSVTYGSEYKYSDLPTPIHILLISAFSSFNLGIQDHTFAFGSF